MTYSEIKSLLARIDNPADKLETLMDLGKLLPPIPENLPIAEIRGCASRVVIARDGNIFYGEADSAIVRGVLFLILSAVQEKSPAEIKNMGLRQEFASLNLALGAGRLNGVDSMISFLENL
jgi:cysteine desulfuration protein SufE